MPDDLRQQLLDLADEYRRRIAAHLAEVETLSATLAQLESAAGEVGEARLTLTSNAEPNTVNAMTATAIDDSDVMRSMANVADQHRAHPFLMAMGKRRETVASVAAWLTERLKRNIHRNTVQGWYAGRRIPKDAAELLRKHYGKDEKGRDRVPLTAWRRVRG